MNGSGIDDLYCEHDPNFLLLYTTWKKMLNDYLKLT